MPSGETLALFALLGGSLLAGYAGSWLLRRHRIGDIAFLLLLGLLVGPVLHLLDPAPFRPAFAILAPLALAVVLFEGGLELAWSDLRRYAARAFATSLAIWSLSVVAAGAVAWLVLGLSPTLAVLFALAVAATGMLAVIPLLAELRAPASARVVLTVETSLGDLLSAVAVVALASMILAGASPADGLAALGLDFAIGGSVGVLAGVASARVLHTLEGDKNAYAILLAILLLSYVFAEAIGGSGLLAALTLGLLVGNARDLMIKGGLHRLAPPASALRLHQNQIIFLLRSVYFVFLGLAMPAGILSWELALVGVALTAALVLARVAAVLLSRAPRAERMLLVAMMPRGLATAVLAGIPLAMGVPGTESFAAYAFVVIVGCDLATSVGLRLGAPRPREPAADGSALPAAH